MDPNAVNSFDRSADNFTPNAPRFNAYYPNAMPQNGNTRPFVPSRPPMPNPAFESRNAASYEHFSQQSPYQERSTHEWGGNNYQQRTANWQSGPYQHFSQPVLADHGMNPHGHDPRPFHPMPPTYQAPNSQNEMYQHSGQIAPDNRGLVNYSNQYQNSGPNLPDTRGSANRNNEYQHYEVRAPDTRGSAGYSQYQQSGPRNQQFYGQVQQNNPYQQLGPAGPENRGMAIGGTHHHQTGEINQPVYVPQQVRNPFRPNPPVVSVPNPFGRTRRENPVLAVQMTENMSYRSFADNTPRSSTTSMSPELPVQTPVSTTNSDYNGNAEMGEMAGMARPAKIAVSGTSAVRQNQRAKPRKDPLVPEDLMNGSIVWLATHEEWHEPIRCVKPHQCNDPVKEADGHNHPVCILRMYQRPGSDIVGDVICDVAIMSTLGSLPLEKYMTKLRKLGPDLSTEWFLKLTLPLSWEPQERHDLRGEALQKERNRQKNLETKHFAELHDRSNDMLSLSRGTMQKRSYVRIHHIYAVPVNQLQPCSTFYKKGWMVRLDQCSFDMVMRRLGLEPGPWDHNVQRSVDEGPQRLQRLRDDEMARVYASQHGATGSYPSTTVNSPTSSCSDTVVNEAF